MKLETKNKHLIISPIILLLVCFLSQSHALTGLELMEKQKDLHEVNTEYTLSTMILIDRKGRERIRELITYAKNKSGESRSLIKFIKPHDIHNVGLLTWQHTGKKDDQWLYLPASKQIKRIVSNGKKKSFMGSDLAYEDMRAEDTKLYNYTLLREESFNGQDCWLIEARPSSQQEKQESGYAKRLIWMRKDIYYSIRIDYFNARKRLLKTALYSDIEQLNDTLWRHKHLSVSNPKKETTTVMQTRQNVINEDISDNIFNPQRLKRPVQMK